MDEVRKVPYKIQVLLFNGQICPVADPVRAKLGHEGAPSSKNFFLRPEGYSIKTATKFKAEVWVCWKRRSKQLVSKVKVEILTVNELWSRFLWNITSFIEK